LHLRRRTSLGRVVVLEERDPVVRRDADADTLSPAAALLGRISFCARGVHEEDARSSRRAQRNLSKPAPSDEDWYLNLVWIERQNCVLVTHSGPLFSIFRAGVGVADLRPLVKYVVAAIEVERRSDRLRPARSTTLIRRSSNREDREP